MAEKKPIGKIEKKKLDIIKGRKVIEIPLIFKIDLPTLNEEDQDEYSNKVAEYYENLKQWIKNFESQIGKIDKVYLQSLTKNNKDELEKLDYIKNKDNIYYILIKNLIDKGAELQVTENTELVNESLAWLSQNQTPDVLEVDFQLYLETIKDRDNFIVKQIEMTLKEDETALLLIGIEHSFSFPKEIEFIKFRPPVIDDIIRLLKLSS